MHISLLANLPNECVRPRIAIIRALQLGDVLCAIPAMRAIRNAVPSAEITFIGLPWGRSLIPRFSHLIDHFQEFPGFPGLPEQPFDSRVLMNFMREAQSEQFDLAIQMHGSGSFINPFVMLMGAKRSAGYFVPGDLCPDRESFLPYPDDIPEVHRHLRLAEFLGAPSDGDHLEFPLNEGDEDELSRVEGADELEPGNYICVHPGARWPSRRWGAAKFAAIADNLSHKGWRIVLTGSSGEVELVAAVSGEMRTSHLNLAGRTGLGPLGVLLRDARLLVSADTGVSHLASALKVPSVIAVMGSDYARWAPLDQTLHPLIMAPVDCRPCEHFICPIDHVCETGLTTDAVQAAIDSILQLPGPGCRLDKEARLQPSIVEVPIGWPISPQKEPAPCVDYAC